MYYNNFPVQPHQIREILKLKNTKIYFNFKNYHIDDLKGLYVNHLEDIDMIILHRYDKFGNLIDVFYKKLLKF